MAEATAATAAISKAQAAVEANKTAKPTRKPTESYKAVYESAEEALKEKNARNGVGPSRAFKIILPKDVKAGTYFVMAHDKWFVAGNMVRETHGAVIEELGAEPRARTPRGPQTITTASLEKMKEETKAMTPEQKKLLAEQAQKLLALLK